MAVWAWAFAPSQSMVGDVHSARLVAAHGDVRLLVDVGEGRVERLRVAVVEGARLAVVLAHDHDEVLHLAVPHQALLFALQLVQADSWRVPNRLLSRHQGLLPRLDRERVLALVPRMVAPVSPIVLSLCHPIRFGFTGQGVFPGDTAAKIVPIDVTVEGDEAEEAPEDPSHFADHPDVRLTHVICNMEDHDQIGINKLFLYIFKRL